MKFFARAFARQRMPLAVGHEPSGQSAVATHSIRSATCAGSAIVAVEGMFVFSSSIDPCVASRTGPPFLRTPSPPYGLPLLLPKPRSNALGGVKDRIANKRRGGSDPQRSPALNTPAGTTELVRELRFGEIIGKQPRLWDGFRNGHGMSSKMRLISHRATTFMLCLKGAFLRAIGRSFLLMGSFPTVH